MKGLVLQDIYAMKKTLMLYVGMFFFFMIFAFIMKSPSYAGFMFMGMIMGTNIIFSLLTLGENGGFAFALGLPLSRRQIIKSKYVLLLMGLFIVITLGIIGGVIISLVSREEPFWIGAVIGSSGYFVFVMEIIIPVCLKWGTGRGRMLFMAIVAVMAFGVVGFSSKIDSLINNGLGNDFSSVRILGVVIGAVICVGYFISYMLSQRIFEKKEI